MKPRLVAALVAVVAAASVLAACGDGGKPGDASFDRCMEAFAWAARGAEPGYGLRHALRRCEHLADWRVAANAHPSATEGKDSVEVLARLCSSSRSGDVQRSRLCEQAFIVHPELEPATQRQAATPLAAGATRALARRPERSHPLEVCRALSGDHSRVSGRSALLLFSL